jgi:hypothetical protein
MIEIKVHVIHEWRPGHADPLARIEKGIKLMNDNVSRLVTSVDNLAIAIDNQNASIAEVATAIRNHPASTTDNGTLSSLADRLDSITTSLNNSTAALHGLAGEENTEDATGDSATAPADPAPLGGADDSSGADAASGADATGDTTTDAGASDGAGNDGSTGEASGDASSSDASSGDTSGEAPADPAV